MVTPITVIINKILLTRWLFFELATTVTKARTIVTIPGPLVYGQHITSVFFRVRQQKTQPHRRNGRYRSDQNQHVSRHLEIVPFSFPLNEFHQQRHKEQADGKMNDHRM